MARGCGLPVRPEKQKPQWGFLSGRTPAKRACRSLKLAAFAAFAGPLDLLTRFARHSKRMAHTVAARPSGSVLAARATGHDKMD